MGIINLTPHAISVFVADKKHATFEKADFPARVSAKIQKIGHLGVGIQISKTTYGEVVNLPEISYRGVWGALQTAATYPTKAEAIQAVKTDPDFIGRGGDPSNCRAELANYYIVSRMVANALPNRKDLLVPNELVRDDQGNIIGCRSFEVRI